MWHRKQDTGHKKTNQRFMALVNGLHRASARLSGFTPRGDWSTCAAAEVAFRQHLALVSLFARGGVSLVQDTAYETGRGRPSTSARRLHFVCSQTTSQVGSDTARKRFSNPADCFRLLISLRGASVRGITGTVIILFIVGYGASTIELPRAWSKASSAQQRMDDGWRRTTHGWERCGTWKLPPAVHDSAPIAWRIHPLAIAAFQVLISLAALAAAERTSRALTPPLAT